MENHVVGSGGRFQVNPVIGPPTVHINIPQISVSPHSDDEGDVEEEPVSVPVVKIVEPKPEVEHPVRRVPTRKASLYAQNPKTDSDLKRRESVYSLSAPDGGRTRKESVFHNSRGNDRSYVHRTRDAIPRINYYKNLLSFHAAQRPTIDDLLENTPPKKVDENDLEAQQEAQKIKFGWIKGVLVRCVLNIWGVMLFLRLSWCIGQAGVGFGSLIIIGATIITTITALSMSAICTNGNVRAGGTYYMISRSLGPEIGASIGLIFSLANAVAVAMYVVGFSESMVDMLKRFDTTIFEDDLNSIRVIGGGTVIVLLLICLAGLDWEATVQVVLLVILLVAIGDFIIGSFIGPRTAEQVAKGFIGYNLTTFKENFSPDFRYYDNSDQTFFSVFAIFFPAATGILAGANISGDLKDPQTAIPKGTILAIFITTLTYLGFGVISGFVMVRDATGDTLGFSKDELMDSFSFTNCTGDDGCKFGLMNNMEIMELVSIWGPLIYAGVFAATLSSALASLVSAPKVFQALCKDKIYPGMTIFARGFGKNQEPYPGYFLAFCIALGFVVMAKLNAIAPLISNFFLAAYGLINFSTFHAEFVKPTGWRPTFRYYNKWLSLVGFGLSIAAMFLINWPTALGTLGLVIVLYLIVLYRKPDINWGSSAQAQIYKSALVSAHNLNELGEHVKNYQPQILLLSGYPCSRPSLIDFAYLITKKTSLLMCAHFLKEKLRNREKDELNNQVSDWFAEQKIKGFYNCLDCTEIEEGSQTLLKAAGIGKLKPNILLMGFKQNWATSPPEEVEKYFNTVQKALEDRVSVAILRTLEGFDFSDLLPAVNEELNGASNDGFETDDDISNSNTPTKGQNGKIAKVLEPKDEKIEEIMSRFHRSKKYDKGFIDVWWLYDDGGLTLLLPYILTTRKVYSQCKLRIFIIAERGAELDLEKRSMAEMLSKLRIDFTDLTIVTGVDHPAKEATLEVFKSYMAPFRQNSTLKDADIIALKEKTNRHLRFRELLLEHSKDSTMVVMTLPVPRKEIIPPQIYMSWLDLLSRDLPCPFLFVRGNQQSVLTFYS